MTINDLTDAPVEETPRAVPTPKPIINDTIVPEKVTHSTEIVELPSKGLLYAEDSPLRSGKVEMKYMTTREEDILSTQSYIKSGIVLDKLFQSMITTKFDYDQLLLGDRNAIMVAARIYGYGPVYETTILNSDGTKQPVSVDLRELKHKEIDESLITPGTTKLNFRTSTGDQIEFQLLTVAIQKDIEKSLTAQKKHAGMNAVESNLTTRLRYMITSINGDTNKGVINSYIENMRAMDSRAFREFIAKVQPDIDLTIEVVDEATKEPFRTEILLGLDLFWPDFQR